MRKSRTLGSVGGGFRKESVYPTQQMIKTATWINIDTGAANGPGWHPMLLRLEDEKPFYADQ